MIKIPRTALAAAALSLSLHTIAAEPVTNRLAELERQVDALAAEIERIRLQDIAIDPGDRKFGLSPAASKVYFKESGLSLGGYGEMLYQNFDDPAKPDDWDFLRMVLYVGYKYNERIILNTELELEHASTDKKGYASVEFAYIDYLWRPELNLRGGVVLIPVGLISEYHEPTTFFGARRPDIEQRIIPSTWRENGVGVFGDVGKFSYKAYLVNGLKGEDFSAAGLRGGRQKASHALAEDLAGVLRIDYSLAEDFIVGASIYHGDSSQTLPFSLQTTLYEAHVDWRWRGLSVRALGVVAEIDNAARLTQHLERKAAAAAAAQGKTAPPVDPVGERMVGAYLEAGYDILDLLRPDGEAALSPFVRFESYNTQDRVPSGYTASGKNEVDLIVVGLNFKPIEQVVLKGEYQFYDDAANSLRDQWNLLLGYVF
ncbi:MAG: hypothetical protein NZ740_09735 [Kiritimatiellae bacterium]|nr:hypothetical protein [Kiritimatiellia bacterium]MDW8459374.1 hypothetical protein [Verrucomicrobiota bacterium]